MLHESEQGLGASFRESHLIQLLQYVFQLAGRHSFAFMFLAQPLERTIPLVAQNQGTNPLLVHILLNHAHSFTFRARLFTKLYREPRRATHSSANPLLK